MTIHAVSYRRFSSKIQERGTSIARQTDWAESVCEKEGWILEPVSYVDLGKSGFHGSHREAGLGEVLLAIQEGAIKPGWVLLIESMDRLSRETIDEHYQLFRQILSSGVEIKTKEAHFTKKSLNDFAGLVQALVFMQAAHVESEEKSKRAKGYWDQRRKKGIVHHRCPAWLEIVEDKWKVKQEPAKIIKLIYQWAKDGFGIEAITKRLVAEKFKPFGTSGHWTRSYVSCLLSDASLKGDYQPHQRVGKKRVPIGEVRKNYFPVVIEADLWAEVRQIVSGRNREKGRSGKGVANLFTGILFDARDKTGMNVVYHGDYAGSGKHSKFLLSYGSRHGAIEKLAFPYSAFETAFLDLVKELRWSESTAVDPVPALEIRLAEVQSRIEKVKKRFREDESEVALEMLADLDKEKRETVAALDKARAEKPSPNALDEAQDLLKRKDRESVRIKIKSRIKQFCSSIWCLPYDEDTDTERNRFLECQIFFKNGTARMLLLGWIRGTGDTAAIGSTVLDSVEKRDFRNWKRDE